MINLSELVRKEDKTSFFNSLKFAHSSDVYLAEEIGDFLANKGRIYVPSFKQFPMPILDSYFSFYYVKMHDVFLEYLDIKSYETCYKRKSRQTLFTIRDLTLSILSRLYGVIL